MDANQPSGSGIPGAVIYTLLCLAITACIIYMIYTNTKHGKASAVGMGTQEPTSTQAPIQSPGPLIS